MADITPRFIDTTTKPAAPPVPTVEATPPPPAASPTTSDNKSFWNSLWHTSITTVFAAFIAMIGTYSVQLRTFVPQLNNLSSQNTVLNEQLKTSTAAVQEANKQIADLKAAVPKESTVEKIKKYYFLMKNPDGSYELRTGGSVAWRYNNPGKIAFGDWAKNHGAIGEDGPMAIFPSYDLGMSALEALFFGDGSPFKSLTTAEAISKFATAKDGYNTDDYLAFILKHTKVRRGTVLSSLTADDRTDFLTAIRDRENFVAGQSHVFKDEDDFKKNGIQ